MIFLIWRAFILFTRIEISEIDSIHHYHQSLTAKQDLYSTIYLVPFYTGNSDTND